jgi:predicted RNA polymerase sigma factor
MKLGIRCFRRQLAFEIVAVLAFDDDRKPGRARGGNEAGLTHIDAVLEDGELANYYLAHSARAEMYRRLGRTTEARSSYEKALALTQQEPERQFLQERIRQLK